MLLFNNEVPKAIDLVGKGEKTGPESEAGKGSRSRWKDKRDGKGHTSVRLS